MSNTPTLDTPRFIFIPYFYVATPQSAIGASGSTQAPLLLDEDADFELHWMTGTSTLDAATDFRPNNFSVQITDKNNSRIWSNARVPQIAMVPKYVLSRPVLLARRSNLSFDFLNLIASSNTPTVILHGFKVIKN